LLHSGQFKEALQVVLGWLYKVEPQLGEDQLVHGDTDTVFGLREEHKVTYKLHYTLLFTYYVLYASCCHLCCNYCCWQNNSQSPRFIRAWACT